jgi:hypothetical protein
MNLRDLINELAAGESIEFHNSNHDTGRIVMRSLRPCVNPERTITTERTISLHITNKHRPPELVDEEVRALITEHRKRR